MPTLDTQLTSHSQSQPRRFRWRRTILLIVFIGLTVTFALHQWWSAHASGQLEAQIEEYRRQGQPVTLKELGASPVPDDQNAAIDLRAAGRALQLTDEQRKFLDDLDFPCLPLTGDERKQLGEIVNANAEVFTRIQAARTKPSIDWMLSFDTPSPLFSSPDWQLQRKLARFICAAALYAHQAGEDRMARERIEGALFIAHAMSRQPTLTGYLVSIGLEALALDVLVEISHDLRLDSPAERKQVQELIGRLLDDQGPRASFVRGMHSERVFQIEMVQMLASGRGDQVAKILGNPNPSATTIFSLGSNVLRPLCLNNGVVMARYTTKVAEAAGAPTWPAAQANMPKFEKIRDSRIRYPLASMLLPALDASLCRHYRLLTDRRMAATALAIRLYAIDHDGKRPQSLDELVPAYLPAIPLDPFANDGGPIRYRPHETEPLLYSTGENGVDDQGSDKAPGPHRSVYRWQQLDATYPLIPKRKPAEEAQ